jgi:hypothetical protein
MSTHFKGGNLVVAPVGLDSKAKIRVQDTDLMFEYIDKNTGLPKSISLTDLLDRVDHLEKALAEFILIGEK